MHAATEDKSVCPKYDVKMIIGDLNAKVDREKICDPTTNKYLVLLMATEILIDNR